MSVERRRMQSADAPATSSARRQRLRTWCLASGVLALVLAACGSSAESSTALTAEEVSATPQAALAEDDGHDENLADHDDHDDHDDDDHDGGAAGLGAHVHGAADVTVAWIGSDVAIDLISPTENVFGFEYEAETEEDLTTIADRTQTLTSADMIAISNAAICELAEPVATESNREASHSEITVSWTFTCEEPDEITEIDFGALFDAFGGFEDIDAEWISETGQSATELSRQQTTIRLER